MPTVPCIAKEIALWPSKNAAMSCIFLKIVPGPSYVMMSPEPLEIACLIIPLSLGSASARLMKKPAGWHAIRFPAAHGTAPRKRVKGPWIVRTLMAGALPIPMSSGDVLAIWWSAVSVRMDMIYLNNFLITVNLYIRLDFLKYS